MTPLGINICSEHVSSDRLGISEFSCGSPSDPAPADRGLSCIPRTLPVLKTVPWDGLIVVGLGAQGVLGGAALCRSLIACRCTENDRQGLPSASAMRKLLAVICVVSSISTSGDW